MEYKLNCAQLRQMAPRLHAGDRVLLSGRVYTSRDAAHKRIVAAMDAGAPAEGMPRRCRRAATSLAKGRSVRVVMRSPGCPKAAIEPVSSGVSAMKNPSR